MSTATGTVSRWTRGFVAAGVGWLVCWQAAVLVGAGRSVAVVLGLYGFVLHTVFGKGYALVPAYFDRSLSFPRAPALHLPLAVAGTAALAADAAGLVPGRWGTAGGLLWALGCAVFVGSLGWSLRGNLTGRETATAKAKADRRRVDRFANVFVPVALAYLVVGTALPNLGAVGLPTGPLPAVGPAPSHLLAAGTAALLLFAVGFRLLPRFLVVAPRRPLVAVVLPAGALGPLLLAATFGGGRWFRIGAALQAVALVGFAVAYVDMFVRSDRRRVGLYGLLVAAAAAVGVAALGVHMATAGFDPGVADAHARLALLGFLGVAVVAVSYQFYPPAVASLPGVDDRTAGAALALLGVGVGLEAGGLLADSGSVVVAGRTAALVGALGHAAVVLAVFRARRTRGR
jgi:hypothetical protein